MKGNPSRKKETIKKENQMKILKLNNKISEIKKLIG